MNYNDDLIIDKYSLDDMLEKQPVIYMRYQEKSKEKQKNVDDLKIEIDIIKNDLKTKEGELFVKYKNLKIDGKTPNDSVVNGMVLMDESRKKIFEKMIKKQKEYNKAVYDYGILDAAVKSFEQRKKSLEKLTELYISGYYSSVNQKKTNADMRAKLKEKR